MSDAIGFGADDVQELDQAAIIDKIIDSKLRSLRHNEANLVQSWEEKVLAYFDESGGGGGDGLDAMLAECMELETLYVNDKNESFKAVLSGFGTHNLSKFAWRATSAGISASKALLEDWCIGWSSGKQTVSSDVGLKLLAEKHPSKGVAPKMCSLFFDVTDKSQRIALSFVGNVVLSMSPPPGLCAPAGEVTPHLDSSTSATYNACIVPLPGADNPRAALPTAAWSVKTSVHPTCDLTYKDLHFKYSVDDLEECETGNTTLKQCDATIKVPVLVPHLGSWAQGDPVDWLELTRPVFEHEHERAVQRERKRSAAASEKEAAKSSRWRTPRRT